jgi:hypothetical protein
LCAFDRTTGRLVWKTYVARGQAEQNMFGRPIREVVPGQVGMKDGLLVYSTNIGVITGIDASTGVTRWVSAYAQDLIPVTENQRTIERFPGWVAGRPTFYGRHAFLAPTDGLWAYAVDLKDGTLTPIQDEAREERLLRSNQNRFRHFLGVHDGLVVASGVGLPPSTSRDSPKGARSSSSGKRAASAATNRRVARPFATGVSHGSRSAARAAVGDGARKSSSRICGTARRSTRNGFDPRGDRQPRDQRRSGARRERREPHGVVRRGRGRDAPRCAARRRPERRRSLAATRPTRARATASRPRGFAARARVDRAGNEDRPRRGHEPPRAVARSRADVDSRRRSHDRSGGTLRPRGVVRVHPASARARPQGRTPSGEGNGRRRNGEAPPRVR